MPRGRVRAYVLIAACVGIGWLLTPSKTWVGQLSAEPVHKLVSMRYDPYDTPALSPYGRLRDARLAGDEDAIQVLADENSGSYLEYLARMTLADTEVLGAEARARHLQRALEIRIDDPLARIETRRLYEWLGELFEEAGLVEEAVEAYRSALPREAARAALKRLVDNPQRLASMFAEARLFRDALFALGSLSLPEIEAPAYRALGDHSRALEAFDRWLSREPDNLDARIGRAWTLYDLEEDDEASSAFRELTPHDGGAYTGLARLALRAGHEQEAVEHYLASNLPANLWRAAELIERNGDPRDAIPVYFDLADMASRHTSEAAYRALVLAEREGDADAAARALDLLPENSYFGLVRDKPLSLPNSDQFDVNPPEHLNDVIELGASLARVHDFEAAKGELALALYRTEDEVEAAVLGQVLQAMGEYRHSSRVASTWLRQGTDNLTTWQLSYPRAHRDIVERYAERYNLDPELIWAVMRQESAFFPEAVSVSNAQGLLQVIPSTWNWIAELKGEEPGDPFDPDDNIRYGAYYLRWLLNYWDGDLELVVTSYNGGQGYVRRILEAEHVDGDRNDFYRFIDRGEPRDYLQQVMLNYAIYRALYR